LTLLGDAEEIMDDDTDLPEFKDIAAAAERLCKMQ
jgi:hypothetical protein